jgi:Uma2 family endonuclease
MTAPAIPAPALGGPTTQTVADLLRELGEILRELGEIPPERVLWNPRPGTATEADLIACVDGADKRLVELVDGTLVEKPLGHYESRVGGTLFRLLDEFAEAHDLGICYSADATLRILPGLVRLPDVSFVAWSKIPNRELPAEAVAALVPDLAVEVLSASNTRREMERKRQEYFRAGVRLVWLIDPVARTAQVFTGPNQFTDVPADGTLDGGDVLPGFRLPLARLFERAGRQRGR